MKGWTILILFLAGFGYVYLNRDAMVEAISLRPSTPSPSELADSAARRVSPVLKAELGALGLKIGDPVFLRVFKESRELELWLHPAKGDSWVFYKTYPLCGDRAEPGPKMSSVTGSAPEGFYYATSRQLRTKGGQLAIDIGYPNTADRQRRHTGKPARIEGGCSPQGSYAAGDAAIEEIMTVVRAALSEGQPYFRIHCFPFRMTDARMNKEQAARAKWLEFWANLKEGYDYFEVLHRPPNATVKRGKYHFE